MKAVFEVVRRVRDWLRSEVPDPNFRLFHTWIFIVMSLISLKQERLTPTRQEILRSTSLSSSSVHRGLGFLIELGIVRQDGKVYDFAIEVPRDILEISTGDGNVTMAIIDDLKRFILAEMPSAGIPSDKIEVVEDRLSQYTPTPEAIRKGTKKRLGDSLI